MKEGEYGFGEVLFDRTSYGSRDKAKEFTGTSTGLWAITAGVYLALMGPKGMKEVGQTIMQKSQYAATCLSEVRGVKLQFRSPFFKEFVVNFDQTGKSVAEINRSIAWLGNFRRLVVRYDRSLTIYQAFLYIACLMIVLRRVLK